MYISKSDFTYLFESWKTLQTQYRLKFHLKTIQNKQNQNYNQDYNQNEYENVFLNVNKFQFQWKPIRSLFLPLYLIKFFNNYKFSNINSPIDETCYYQKPFLDYLRKFEYAEYTRVYRMSYLFSVFIKNNKKVRQYLSVEDAKNKISQVLMEFGREIARYFYRENEILSLIKNQIYLLGTRVSIENKSINPKKYEVLFF